MERTPKAVNVAKREREGQGRKRRENDTSRSERRSRRRTCDDLLPNCRDRNQKKSDHAGEEGEVGKDNLLGKTREVQVRDASRTGDLKTTYIEVVRKLCRCFYD